ncbi:MAG: hypothetical protein NXI23_21160 [Bacteroidetes bacterium]|jgi:hypothetical protein|nr:hypothetical protein [Bacteroidota bacterium]MDF1867868.1 hypothetical protein [Saprospiraceae bacterium]
MKIQFLSIFFLLFLSFPLFAQKQSPYPREFGIDLIWMIVSTSGHEPASTDVELIFKESHDQLDLRFKFLLSSNFRDRDLISSFTKDSIQTLNFYRQRKTAAVNIGVAYNKITSGLPVYVGVDFQTAWHSGDTEVDRCFVGANCKRFQGLSNQHLSVGLIPFFGTKIPLSDRLMFTLEFGTQINYHFGKRKYLDIEDGVQEYNIDGLELQLNRLVNDIAVVYLF